MRRLTLALATLPVLGLQLTAGETLAACQVDTRPVAFGVIDVTRTTDGTGEIVLNCSTAANVEVALDSGAAPGQRYMTGAKGGRLKFELYTDATRSTAWGDGSGNGATVTASNVGEEARRLTIYGRVPRQHPVPADAYTYPLTVVLSFR